jgi:hypothetical protein
MRWQIEISRMMSLAVSLITSTKSIKFLVIVNVSIAGRQMLDGGLKVVPLGEYGRVLPQMSKG